MNTNPLNVYPSSSDATELPIIAGGSGEDPVLACLRNARDRYAEDGIDGSYVSYGGGVCAIGAIIVADSQGSRFRQTGQEINYFIERYLSDAAKQAIQLLDEITEEKWPDIGSAPHYTGPLEYLNEKGPKEDEDGEPIWDFDRRREAVLDVYDEAIRRLESLQPA